MQRSPPPVVRSDEVEALQQALRPLALPLRAQRDVLQPGAQAQQRVAVGVVVQLAREDLAL